MPIFHRGKPFSEGRPDRSQNKSFVSGKQEKSAVEKIFGRSTRPKEEPKSQTAFGNKESMNRQEFRTWLNKQPEFRKDSLKHYPNLSEYKRVQEIEKNIWGTTSGKWGSIIEKKTKEPERRRFEYERELNTSKIMNDVKLKNKKKFEAGLIDKFIDKKK